MNCTTSPQVWQTDRANCPIINSVNPVVIYTDQLTDVSNTISINQIFYLYLSHINDSSDNRPYKYA